MEFLNPIFALISISVFVVVPVRLIYLTRKHFIHKDFEKLTAKLFLGSLKTLAVSGVISFAAFLLLAFSAHEAFFFLDIVVVCVIILILETVLLSAILGFIVKTIISVGNGKKIGYGLAIIGCILFAIIAYCAFWYFSVNGSLIKSDFLRVMYKYKNLSDSDTPPVFKFGQINGRCFSHFGVIRYHAQYDKTKDDQACRERCLSQAQKINDRIFCQSCMLNVVYLEDGSIEAMQPVYSDNGRPLSKGCFISQNYWTEPPHWR
ncbi:MAG: hypothetical protein V1928_03355 [Parcubacteria group bacterium]